MYVTRHAMERIRDRVGGPFAQAIERTLEGIQGELGTVAYIVADVEAKVADDGSNGDTLVAVAVDGSVETVYFRRSTQDMSARFFGAERVEDWRARPVFDDDAPQEWLDNSAHSAALDGVLPERIRQEARSERIRNNRKMGVSGRSTLLLSALSSGQQRRRVSRTRKRGGK
jgi:hypothetical protein